MKNIENIEENGKKRIVIVGGGFAGLTLLKTVNRKKYQIVLIDKNNYHQFQPLYYQVATAGLEPSAIAFPLRKIMQHHKDFHFRLAEAQRVDTEKNELHTTIGKIRYDHLVLAMGATSNYFGMKDVERNSIPMKSLEEALYLRNVIILNFEEALNYPDPAKVEHLFNICIVGGGPTGVELAGALAEMKKYVLPKDYPELSFGSMKIFLVEANAKILNTMSEDASVKARQFLENQDVNVMTNAHVKNFDGFKLSFADGSFLPTKTVIWAAGIRANKIEGLKEDLFLGNGRVNVDEFNRINGCSNVYALGDQAAMRMEGLPGGHPQVAQPAIQQALCLARNIERADKSAALVPFKYKDKGTLATIGRHLAVADLPYLKFQGFFAWILWGFVHLFAILGMKNKMTILIDWVWHYFSYDQALRLLIGRKRTTYL